MHQSRASAVELVEQAGQESEGHVGPAPGRLGTAMPAQGEQSLLAEGAGEAVADRLGEIPEEAPFADPDVRLYRHAGREEHVGLLAQRSEERRVGKKCRSRWSPDH